MGVGEKGQNQFFIVGRGNLPPFVDYHFSSLSQSHCKNMTNQKRSGWQSLNFGIKGHTGVMFAVFFGFFVERVGYFFVPPSLSSSDPSISKC